MIKEIIYSLVSKVSILVSLTYLDVYTQMSSWLKRCGMSLTTFVTAYCGNTKPSLSIL